MTEGSFTQIGDRVRFDTRVRATLPVTLTQAQVDAITDAVLMRREDEIMTVAPSIQRVNISHHGRRPVAASGYVLKMETEFPARWKGTEAWIDYLHDVETDVIARELKRMGVEISLWSYSAPTDKPNEDEASRLRRRV